MPGVPFSKACELCKKRRVKCDERKPGCSPCQKLGKPCPGYKRENKFIDEGARLQKKRLATASAAAHSGDETSTISAWRSSESVSPRSTSPAETLVVSTAPSTAYVFETYDLKEFSFASELPEQQLAILSVPRPFAALISDAVSRQGFQVLLTTHIPVIHCGRLHQAFDYPLGPAALSSTLASLASAEPMPSWVWYLPHRLGSSDVLDAAADCTFATAGWLPTAHPRDGEISVIRKYTKAIAKLRKAIDDPEESMSAEVLAAVCLLSVHECLRSSDLWTWMRHQRGIYQLMERRGPSRYQTDLERQLLISNLGAIFCVALRDNHECFLERPEWQSIIATKPADSIIAEEWTDTYMSLPLLAFVPRLMTRCRAIVRDPAKQTAANIEGLVAAIVSLRERFMFLGRRQGWIEGVGSQDRPSSSSSSAYSPVLAPRRPGDAFRYFSDREDMRVADYVNYLCAMAILNRALLAVRPSAQLLEHESRAWALEVGYLHSFIKSEPQLRDVWLVHAERVAQAVTLTSSYWSTAREQTYDNGSAFDPNIAGGGLVIERWKFDAYDDIMCAREVDAPLMFKYPGKQGGSLLSSS